MNKKKRKENLFWWHNVNKRIRIKISFSFICLFFFFIHFQSDHLDKLIPNGRNQLNWQYNPDTYLEQQRQHRQQYNDSDIDVDGMLRSSWHGAGHQHLNHVRIENAKKILAPEKVSTNTKSTSRYHPIVA